MAHDDELLRSLPVPVVSVAAYSVAQKLALVAHFLREQQLSHTLTCLEREAACRGLGFASAPPGAAEGGAAAQLEQHLAFCLAQLQRE